MANIFNIIYSNDAGHAAVVYLHKKLCAFLEEDGKHKVTHVVLNGTKEGLSISDDDNVIYLGLAKREVKGKTILGRFSTCLKLKKLFLERKVDLIICDGFGVLGPISRVYEKQNRRPYIISIIHGTAFPRKGYVKNVIAMLNSKSCLLVGVSNFVHSHLIKKFPQFYHQSIKYVNNGVDFSEISNALLPRSDARSALGIDEGAFVVGTIGRLAEVKRHGTIIEAVNILKGEGKLSDNFKLVIIGDGSLYSHYQKEINKYGINEYVTLCGHLQEARRYLRALDLYVMASDGEGFGIAVLEAMAARLPVLLSDSDSFVTMIPDERFLFPVNNAFELSEKIVKVMKGEEGYSNVDMSKSVYDYASSEFGIEKFCESYSCIIDDVLR